MTHAVATQPRSLTSHFLRGSSWSKLQALCFRGKALSTMEPLVEVLFDLYKQTTVTRLDTVLAKITRARSAMTRMSNIISSIRGKYPDKHT